MALEREYRYLIRRAIKDKKLQLATQLAEWGDAFHGLNLMCEIPGSPADTMASESHGVAHTTKE